MLSASIVAVALLAGSAIAQSKTGSTALNFTYFDPASVDPQQAASWCIGERTGCQTLCDGNAPTNDCDAQKLTYSCLCANGSAPDLADYKNTLPDFVCQANFAGCIKAHPNDAVGQGNCKIDIQDHCGFLNVSDYKAGSSGSGSSSSSSSSPSKTAAPSSTGGSGGAAGGSDASKTSGGSSPSSTGGSAPAATSSSAAMALVNGKEFGAGVLAAGLFAAFGYML